MNETLRNYLICKLIFMSLKYMRTCFKKNDHDYKNVIRTVFPAIMMRPIYVYKHDLSPSFRSFLSLTHLEISKKPCK